MGLTSAILRTTPKVSKYHFAIANMVGGLIYVVYILRKNIKNMGLIVSTFLLGTPKNLTRFVIYTSNVICRSILISSPIMGPTSQELPNQILQTTDCTLNFQNCCQFISQGPPKNLIFVRPNPATTQKFHPQIYLCVWVYLSGCLLSV